MKIIRVAFDVVSSGEWGVHAQAMLPKASKYLRVESDGFQTLEIVALVTDEESPVVDHHFEVKHENYSFFGGIGDYLGSVMVQSYGIQNRRMVHVFTFPPMNKWAHETRSKRPRR